MRKLNSTAGSERKKSFLARKFGIFGEVIPYICGLILLIVLLNAGAGNLFAGGVRPANGEREVLLDSSNGNETGNLVNRGLLLSDVNIYFSNQDDGGRLYRMASFDSPKPEKVVNDKVKNLCLNDEDIYFINQSHNNRIYRVSTNGGQPEALSKDPADQFFISSRCIFYTNENDRNRIYRIDLDGGSRKRLNKDSCVNLLQDWAWIYYINTGDHDRIYRMRYDGSARHKFVDASASCMELGSDGLYYVGSDDNRIYKVNLSDGNGKIHVEKGKRIGKEKAGSINFQPPGFYYSDLNDNGKLYVMNLDTMVKTKLSEDRNCSLINVGSAFIYYISGGKQHIINNPAYGQPAGAPDGTALEDGSAYSGKTANGITDGGGALTMPNGDEYAGAMEDGVISGFGTMVYADGSSYAGYWENGRRNGSGTFYDSEGNPTKGTWKDDVLIESD